MSATMSSFDSILLPLDGSLQAAKAVPCALWLAERLHATLHVLHSAPHPIVPAKALERLSALAAQRARTVLHQTTVDPVHAVLEATREHHVKLVVMTARGGSARQGSQGSQGQEIEHGPTLG
ncbi:MAG TPA: universal stress protein, partial [Gemmatimonadaceae bacterium]